MTNCLLKVVIYMLALVTSLTLCEKLWHALTGLLELLSLILDWLLSNLQAYIELNSNYVRLPSISLEYLQLHFNSVDQFLCKIEAWSVRRNTENSELGWSDKFDSCITCMNWSIIPKYDCSFGLTYVTIIEILKHAFQVVFHYLWFVCFLLPHKP